MDEDSDNDGLSDFQENDLGTDPLKTDSDGDLTDDLTEFIAGTDPADPESNIPEDSYYIVLPYESDQFIRNLDFDTYIKKVDVLIVIDLSGSMMEEHQNLKEGIKTTIIDGIKAEIPDIGFGLVEFGTLEDKVYKLKQAVTTNSDDVKSAVDSIMSCGGAEEYHTFVLYQSADGDGTSETICTEYMGIIGCSAGPYLINVPEVDCSGSEGNIGGACFRNESLPVIIMASDEAFANDTWYSWNAGTEKTSSIAVDAMNSINAKFIGIDSGSSMNDFDLISQGTGSTDESGNSFNSKINSDGTGLSEKIVESVLDLKQNIRMDIMAKAVHIDNTYGVADTTEFITNISPNAFENTKAGQIVTFEITFKNSFYENESNEAKVFSAKINILGDGTFFLGSKDVYILVPGKSG
ncbi:MAG TPA: hypothetical protein PLZ43_16030 [bacterium]|nr:hypothetical protein [bacterium]